MKKNILSVLIVFCFVAGFAGNLSAWEGAAGSPSDTKSKSGTASGSGMSDETTMQYFKKFRSINSELVAAHQELHKLNNPDLTSKGMNLEDIMNQGGAARDKQRQEDLLKAKKVQVEDKITNLLKDRENLKADLTKYYGGNLPPSVSSAWKTEEDYTEYRVSKYR